MKIENLHSQTGKLIKGPALIKPLVFKDERGFFMESWNKNAFDTLGLSKITFVQDNHSFSYKGVLRGMHYQLPPNQQGKLVRCISGEIFDVIVDIRSSSISFGEWVGVNLSQNNHHQVWIPEGFAHGFLTLSKHAEVIYKVTNYWDRNTERVLSWKDPFVDIKWPLHSPFDLSEKDSNAPFLSELINDNIF